MGTILCYAGTGNTETGVKQEQNCASHFKELHELNLPFRYSSSLSSAFEIITRQAEKQIMCNG